MLWRDLISELEQFLTYDISVHRMDLAGVRRRRSTLKSKMKWGLENSLLEEGNQATKQQYQCIRPRTSHFSPASHFSSSHKENTSFQTNSVEGLHTLRSRPRKSFSGFGHAVDELFLPQRSASKFHKVPHSSNSPEAQIEKEGLHGELRRTISHDSGNKLPIRSKTSRWLRRCVSVTLRHHRRPTPCLQSYEESPFDFDCLTSPIPGAGIKPPKIPENLASGAAARAAAAIQNEVLESVRNLRLADLKIPTDSESGIGIEVQDQEDDSTETISRIDPVEKLPEELMVLILSYLDAGSLINAELVSCRWNYSASSHHVWKYVFRKEFHRAYSTAPKQNNQFLVGGSGLGRTIPNQDWKRMWRARKALHQRWQDGYAAAIYLDGHTDSVYCVQFDEHKILTGSRDRTIRVWDAHTYECIKILGVPTRCAPVKPLSLTSDSNTRGQRPFKTIFYPRTTIKPTVAPSSLCHDGSILCLQFNDEIMITGSSDCTCIVWDIKAGYRPVRQLRHHTAGVLDVCFDDKYIVSCSKDTTVCLWDQRTGEFLRKLSGHRGPVNAVQLRGDLVVSASGDGIAKLWNLTSGLCIKEFPSKDRGMACVEFSPDSRTILAGGNDHVIYQFDTNTGELVRELSGHRGLVRSLHLDSANGRVVSGSYDSSVKAYDLSTGDNVVDFTGWTTSWILSAKADYRRIVATSQDSRAVVMDFGYELPGVDLLEG